MSSILLRMKTFSNSFGIQQQDTVKHEKIINDTALNSVKTNAFVQKSNKIASREIEKNILLSQHKDSLDSIPEFYKIVKNKETFATNYRYYFGTGLTQDTNCYIVNNSQGKKNELKILIEKQQSTKHVSQDYSINPKHSVNSDWTFLPIFLGLALLASIVTLYRKYLGLLFESIVYRFTSNKILNEKNIQFQRLTFMLDFMFILSFAIIVDQIIKYFGLYEPPEKFKYLIFIAFGSFLFALRLFRLIIFRLAALFSNHQNFFHDLFKSSSLYTRTLGLFLLPMAFLITYSTGIITSLCIYLSIFVILIMLILRTISMLRGFIVGGFSIFYFILYLCALEIVPLLVIWKEVKSR